MSAAKEFLLSSIGQKYLDAVDKDARKALDAMKSNLSAMSQYPSGLVSEYKGDGAQLDKAWGEFNAEASRLACGKADKPAKMVAAYSRYVLSLEVLETQNVRFGAFIAVDYAKAVELVLAIFQLAFLFQKKAFATLVAVTELLYALRAEPARRLARGGTALPDARRLATAASVAHSE